MDDGMNGDFKLIHNGKGLPNTFTVTASTLTTGLPYRFYVVAANYIGNSIPSAITTIYACVAPSGFDKPYKGSVTSTSVELFWTAPDDDGGCPLTGYSILRDDGNGGPYIEVHAVSVTNRPSLNTFTVTDLPATPLGLSIRFKKVAYNKGAHSVTSSSRTVVIASVPLTPLTGPLADTSVTSGSILKFIYSAPSNGGAPIINYELQMDDGLGAGFTTIAGGES